MPSLHEGRSQVRDSFMEQLPNLKVISRCGVGLDNIDVSSATKRGIKVVNAPNSNADTIAEHTIALLLMLQRNLYNAVTMVKENRWETGERMLAMKPMAKLWGLSVWEILEKK